MTVDQFAKSLKLSSKQIQQIRDLKPALDAFDQAIKSKPTKKLLSDALQADAQDSIDYISRLVPGLSRDEIEELLAEILAVDGITPLTISTLFFVVITKFLNCRP